MLILVAAMIRTSVRDGSAASEPGVGAILQDVEELGLQGGGHLSDLVEEDGASVADLELAGLALYCSGEGALLVAEEFAFEQVCGHRRAIDLEEHLAGAAGHLVRVHGDDLFAGAAFAEDKYGDVRACD